MKKGCKSSLKMLYVPLVISPFKVSKKLVLFFYLGLALKSMRIP